MNKNIFIIVGPSGVGKGTLVNMLLDEHPNFAVPSSYTTRPPRPIESKYKKYIFVSETEFMQAVNENKILEYERTHGHLYGTSRKAIDDSITANRVIVADIDFRGAETYRQIWKDKAVVIFISFASMDSLRVRLINDPARKGITENEIQARIKTAETENEFATRADHTIINQDGKINETYTQLKDIIHSYID